VLCENSRDYKYKSSGRTATDGRKDPGSDGIRKDLEIVRIAKPTQNIDCYISVFILGISPEKISRKETSNIRKI